MDILKLDDRGLIPAVVQHVETKDVLMLAYMNRDSILKTLETGDVWFFSRSRNELWHKGETSGNYLRYRSGIIDCDGDTILIQALPEGPACHTGSDSCFQSDLSNSTEYVSQKSGTKIFRDLFDVIQERKESPITSSYTTSLLEGDINRIAQKVVEEAGEAALAGATGRPKEFTEEMGDLVYHAFVLMVANGVTLEDVGTILQGRRSG